MSAAAAYHLPSMTTTAAARKSRRAWTPATCYCIGAIEDEDSVDDVMLTLTGDAMLMQLTASTNGVRNNGICLTLMESSDDSGIF